MKRVTIDADWLATHAGATGLLPYETGRYTARVLRLRRGDTFLLTDGTGRQARATIERADGGDVTVSVDTPSTSRSGESPLAIALVVGLPKGDRWEWVVQKTTELGVAELHPVFTSRTTVKLPAARAEKKLVRWRRIAADAARQCERSCAPTILAPQKLETLLAALDPAQPDEWRLVATTLPTTEHSIDATRSTPRRAVILIGPEGGFSEAEVALAVQRGFAPIHLGPRILRTDTAAVAAATLLQHRFGDIG